MVTRSSPSHRASPVLLHMAKITTTRERSRPLPDQVRSEDRSGLTRHRIPASPRGYRDTVSNCDHQPMQRTYREPQDRARPAGSGQTVSVWQRSRPPESGHGLYRIRSVLKADRVRFDRLFLQPRGADGPSCRNAATGTHNAYTNARVIKPVPSARAGSDRHHMA